MPRGDAGLRSITTDHRPRAGWDLPARGARARILSLHRIGGSSGSRGHRGGCAATARSNARAEDQRHDRGADGEGSRVWPDVSRSGRSWTSQHLRKRTRHRASTFPTSGSAAGLSGCSRAARELVAPRLGTEYKFALPETESAAPPSLAGARDPRDFDEYVITQRYDAKVLAARRERAASHRVHSVRSRIHPKAGWGAILGWRIEPSARRLDTLGRLVRQSLASASGLS